MESKECLERLYNKAYHDEYLERASQEKAVEFLKETTNDYNTIKQDLERLEKLAHENASLHTEIQSLHTKLPSLSSETEKIFKEFLDKKNQKLKLKYEIEKNKQKPFSREEVVILSRNEKIAIDNKILSLEHENKKLENVIDIISNKIWFAFGLDAERDDELLQYLTQEEFELINGELLKYFK